MGLGGGTWLTQNKILPGTYINFISVARASATLSDRGIATMPHTFDWGVQGEVVEVSTSDFQKNSLRLFGYDYTAPELRGLRDLFRNIRIAYLYRLGTGGTKAACDYATAKYAGTRGNSLKIVIAVNVDDSDLFDVSAYFDAALVDAQTVATAADLVNNDYVDWISTAELAAAAGTPLTGGTEATLSNGDYQTYLDLIEGYGFNAIGCPSNDTAVKGLFTAFTKRLRDEQGIKFQCVEFNPSANSDYEGVIDILNAVTDTDANPQDAVYWVTGVAAGTAVNKSATNKVYDGEYTLNVKYTQKQLEDAITGGKFAFHRVGDTVRVLEDIDSLVNVTLEKGDDFKSNQTVRVIDQIGNDIAVLFNTRYLGVVPNDDAGRVSLWADIVEHHRQLEKIRAIEDFSEDDVTVVQGDTKKAVLVGDDVSVVNAMEKLYMAVYIA
jgi:hypothetical protein